MRIHTQGAWLNEHMGAAREEREENYLIRFRCIKNVCSIVFSQSTGAPAEKTVQSQPDGKKRRLNNKTLGFT